MPIEIRQLIIKANIHDQPQKPKVKQFSEDWSSLKERLRQELLMELRQELERTNEP